MSNRQITQEELTSWIEFSLRNEKLSKFETVFAGKTNKGDGYFGEIVFVTVNGTTKDNQKRVLELVIKHGKNNSILRKVTKVRSAYETEIHLYEKILPIFQKFQIEKSIKERFESVPKCYATLTREDMEVLILENLRPQGYELLDRTKTMNFNHLAFILNEYGKFHALSFALRDQNRKEFNSLIKKYGNPFESFLMDRNKRDAFDENNAGALRLLQEHGEENLRKKLENILVKDTIQIILDLEPDDEPQSVVLHGDCWSNNFLFKYKDNDRTSPSQVRILDWQMSTVRSPVFDLSYLLYANSSQEELSRVEELLKIYYSSLSDFLKQLGSDPEKLFTYEDLKRHWRKYSIFCMLFAPTLYRFLYCKKENAPAVETMEEGQDMTSFMRPEIGDEEAYYNRLKTLYTHHFGYVLK